MNREVLRSTLRLAIACTALLVPLGTFAVGYYVGYFQAWHEVLRRNVLTLHSFSPLPTDLPPRNKSGQ